MREIVFRCTATTYGLPFPYVPDRTIVILIQQGEESIGKYEEPTEDDPFPMFSHPTNNAELKQEALESVKSFYPDIERSGTFVRLPRKFSLQSKMLAQKSNIGCLVGEGTAESLLVGAWS